MKLFDQHDSIADQVSVKFKGTTAPIEKLTVAEICIRNEGCFVIDYKEARVDSDPLKIHAKSGVKILSQEIVHQDNKSSECSLSLARDKSCATFNFKFFNSGQGVIIKICHSGDPESSLTLVGQLKDVEIVRRSEIEMQNPDCVKNRSSDLQFVMFHIFLIALLLEVFTSAIFGLESVPTPDVRSAISGASLILFLYFAIAFIEHRRIIKNNVFYVTSKVVDSPGQT